MRGVYVTVMINPIFIKFIVVAYLSLVDIWREVQV